MKRNAILTGLLFAAVLLAGTFTGFQDWKLLTNSTGNPASGYLRMFGNNSTGTFDALNSSGSHVYFPANLAGSYNTGSLALSSLASQAADTVVMNASGSSAAPTAVAMPTSGTNGCAGTSNALTYNTSTHALGCNTISGGGGGAWAVLEQHTASNSAELDFTTWQSSSYTVYKIVMSQILPATNSARFALQFSTNGGSTWDTTSGNYAWSEFGFANGGSVLYGTQSDSSIHVIDGHNGLYNVSPYTSSGEATMNVASGVWPTMFWTSQHATSTDQPGNPAEGGLGNGVYRNTSQVNAFRVLMSSGNIASGTVRVYGFGQ